MVHCIVHVFYIDFLPQKQKPVAILARKCAIKYSYARPNLTSMQNHYTRLSRAFSQHFSLLTAITNVVSFLSGHNLVILLSKLISRLLFTKHSFLFSFESLTSRSSQFQFFLNFVSLRDSLNKIGKSRETQVWCRIIKLKRSFSFSILLEFCRRL